MEEKSLVEGAVWKQLILFTLPFMGTSLIQTLYSMVDLYIVGNYATTADVSAVSVAGTVVSTFAFMIIGMGVGATVLVGHMFGAGRHHELEDVVKTSFTLFPLLSLIMSIILMIFVNPIISLINTPESAIDGARAYLLICLAGYFFQGIYNTLSGILRGLGNSKPTLIIAIWACIFNIVGDIILVGGFGMGARGAAIATTGAQIFSAVFGCIYVKIKFRDFPFEFKLSGLGISRNHVKELIKIGLPVGLQETLVMFSFIIIEAVVNSLGVDASAAAGILDKMFILCTIPAMGFNSSISAFVAQNHGAGREDRCVKCLGYGTLICFTFGLIMMMWAWLDAEGIVRIFTSDQNVIEQGITYFHGYKFEYPAYSVAYCIAGFINGCGKTKFVLITNLIATYAVRVPLTVFLVTLSGGTLLELGYALPVASVVQAVVGGIFFFTGVWKAREGKV